MIKNNIKNKSLDWYLQWSSSIVLIFGTVLTSMNMYPYNMFFQFIGLGGWLIVSIMWRNTPLILVNLTGVLTLFIGIMHWWLI